MHKNVDGESLVYDLDARLDFPCSFSVYANHVLHDDSKLKPFLQRSV